MDNIKLNFINRSNDTNNLSVVIYQKNIANEFDETHVAWKVIQNCGFLENHPFTYSLNFSVCFGDPYGNFSPQLKANNGQAFEVITTTSGDMFQISSTPSTNATEVEVRNSLTMGAIDANCYRDGKLLAVNTGLSPGQKAIFEFHPKIYIGVVSQIEEGEIMNAAMVSEINTEINLFGISSADIVMTGGGPGESSTGFHFNLENVKK